MPHRLLLPILWLAMIALFACAWRYTVDDAYIVARYARHLAEGHGYTMNPGGSPSDGVTAPLWLLPAIAGVRMGVSPLVAAKLTGAVCGLLAATLLVVGLTRRQRGRLASVVAVALLLCQPTWATWTVAGLATGLAACLVALAAYGTGAAAPRPVGLMCVCGACVGMSWVRPELVPSIGVLALAPLAVYRRPLGARLCWYVGGLFLGLLGVVWFRWWMFGDPVPLSLRAKPARLSNGVEYLQRALPWVTGVGGLWLLVCAYRWGATRDRIGVAALGTGVVGIALSGGDWMPGFRLIAPLLPLYAVVAGVGFARAWLRGDRTAPLLALITALAMPAVDWALRLPAIADGAESREGPGVQLAEFLANHGDSVALVDVGFVAYRSGLRVLDLGGVTDATIADLPGDHLSKRIPQALLKARAPDLIVLHSRDPPRMDSAGRLVGLAGYPVERRVASMPWVRSRYRVLRVIQYAPRYYYVVLGTQRQDTRPQTGRVGTNGQPH